MRPRKPFGRTFTLASLGLFTATAIATTLTLFAPVADASPESDATDAINAAWEAAGGDASLLGPRDGGVYPVGAGFGQNFASGAIYFTPQTGAKAMFGAILEKYRALGGPADSDLGFPDIDEGAGKVSPDSRNTTFSAGDHPVIFWTPQTGAWVVRGPINAAWDKLGGSSGVLGVPVADETYSGDVVSQSFSGGKLTFDTATKTFTTEPPDLAGQLAGLNIPTDAASAIATVWRASGGASGPLGLKQGDQYAIGDDGAGQNFAGGKVFFTPETGAHAVAGDILTEYESAGGPTGDLGFPTTGESDGGVPDSRVSTFSAPDKPVIFWTKDHGAVVVRGAMKAAWDKLGGATGALGVPEGAQNSEGATVTQKFSGGEVSWDSSNNAFTTDPANLAEQLSGLEVPEAPVPSTPAAPPAGDADKGFTWQNWWLWWIIPLAVLLLGSLFAWLAMRRRRGYAEPEFDEDREVHRGYQSVFDAVDAEPEAEVGPWAARLGRDERADADREPETTAFASSRGGWSDGDAATTRLGEPGDEDLFTHRGVHEAVDVDEAEDSDDVDTDPTGIPAVRPDDEQPGRHARSLWEEADDDDAYLPGPGSLFAPVYGAAPPPRRRYAESFDESDEPEELAEPEEFVEFAEPDREPEDTYEYEPAETHDEDERHDAGAPPAIHLPLDDPNQPPDGYPVKGSMSSGRYHVPGSEHYDDTVAEIWFASAELAEANGFQRAD